jgi:hypothetical protein
MKILLIVLALTGCATPPQWLANYYDRNDPCQTGAGDPARQQLLGRPLGYQQPSFCGAGSTRTYIYNQSNQRIGYIK